MTEEIHQVPIVGVLVFVVGEFAVGIFFVVDHAVGHRSDVFIENCCGVGELIGRNVVVEDGVVGVVSRGVVE